MVRLQKSHLIANERHNRIVGLAKCVFSPAGDWLKDRVGNFRIKLLFPGSVSIPLPDLIDLFCLYFSIDAAFWSITQSR
jgi:hypothetical protein